MVAFSTNTWIGLGLLGAVGAYLLLEKQTAPMPVPVLLPAAPVGSKPVAKASSSIPGFGPSGGGDDHSTTPPPAEDATIEEYGLPLTTGIRHGNHGWSNLPRTRRT